MGAGTRDIFGNAPDAQPATPGSYGEAPSGHRLPDETRLGPVRVKVARRGSRVVNAAPEFEDCVKLAAAGSVPVKDVQAMAVQAYGERYPDGVDRAQGHDPGPRKRPS